MFECKAAILSGPDWWQNLYHRLLKAREQVRICMYLLSPNWHDSQINIIRTLNELPERGIDARIVLSAAPLNIGKRQPNIEAARKLVKGGWNVRLLDGRKKLHEKTVVIDGRWTFIGSHNMSYSSATTNLDCSVLIDSEHAARIATDQFNARWRMAKDLDFNRWNIQTPLALPFEP